MDPIYIALAQALAPVVVQLVQDGLKATQAPTQAEVEAKVAEALAKYSADPQWLQKSLDAALAKFVQP